MPNVRIRPGVVAWDNPGDVVWGAAPPPPHEEPPVGWRVFDDVIQQVARNPENVPVDPKPVEPKEEKINYPLIWRMKGHTALGLVPTIGEYYGKSGFTKDKNSPAMALELENETIEPFRIPNLGDWEFHQEGSLRHFGFEFVTRGAFTKDVLQNKLDYLIKKLRIMFKETGAKETDSHRTSTHLHVDMTKYTYIEMLNFSILYWILEEFLSHFAGESRKSNLFCLRLKDCNAQAQSLANEVQKLTPYASNLFDDHFRYSSLNFASIPKFGSLEFRMMRGTLSDDEIMTWVNAIDAIRSFSLKFRIPPDIKKFFIDTDAEQLPIMVFGQELFDKLIKHHPNPKHYPDELRRGFMAVSVLMNADKRFSFEKEFEEAKAVALKEQKAMQEDPYRDPIRFRPAQEILQQAHNDLNARAQIRRYDQDVIPDGADRPQLDEHELIPNRDIMDE